jgi:hypothetical protein
MASILEDHALPWYVIDADRRVIRVYHGDLDQSWWKRGMSDGEGKVRKVGDIIREATGLQRVTCIHDGNVVEFRVRKELFNRAAVALKMSIKCVAESNDLARRMVDRKRKPE